MPFGSVSLLSMTVSAELVNTYNAGNNKVISFPYFIPQCLA